MTTEYTSAALQRTFDYLLSDQARASALTTELTTRVLSSPVEPTGPAPYGRLQAEARSQVQLAALATEAPGIEGVWGRAEVEENAPMGIWKTLEMLQVVEQLYVQHATVPQRIDVVAGSLDRVTRHLVGFARMGGATIGDNSLAQSQGIDPQDPNAPKVRRMLMGGGVSMESVSPFMYQVRTAEDGQIALLPRFRNVHTNPRQGHCGAADTLVVQQGETRPALYTFLRILGSVAATTIYPRSFATE